MFNWVEPRFGDKNIFLFLLFNAYINPSNNNKNEPWRINDFP